MKGGQQNLPIQGRQILSSNEHRDWLQGLVFKHFKPQPAIRQDVHILQWCGFSLFPWAGKGAQRQLAKLLPSVRLYPCL